MDMHKEGGKTEDKGSAAKDHVMCLVVEAILSGMFTVGPDPKPANQIGAGYCAPQSSTTFRTPTARLVLNIVNIVHKGLRIVD